MKLTTVTNVTVDGVMQGLGGADEDRRGGFERSGSGDLAAAVRELKAEREGELQVHGGGTLIRWLFENDLVDEVTLITYPLVIGRPRYAHS